MREADIAGDVVALRLAEDFSVRFGRAHIVNTQVQRGDEARLVERGTCRHAGQIVEERRQHAAMNHARVRIADKALLPGLNTPDSALFQLRDAEAHPAPPRDAAGHDVQVFSHHLPGFDGWRGVIFHIGPHSFDLQLASDNIQREETIHMT